MKKWVGALSLVILTQQAFAGDWTMLLQCNSDGILVRLQDNRKIARFNNQGECNLSRDASHGGVICVYFTPEMPVGPGSWNEIGWRAMNIETGIGLGRKPHATKEQCLDSTRAAGGGLVCTNTGLGAKATNIDTNMWCGASAQLKYCLESTRYAADGLVCSFPANGTGAEPGWMKTRVTTTCDYQGNPMSLEACNGTLPAPAPTPF